MKPAHIHQIHRVPQRAWGLLDVGLAGSPLGYSVASRESRGWKSSISSEVEVCLASL